MEPWEQYSSPKSTGREPWEQYASDPPQPDQSIARTAPKLYSEIGGAFSKRANELADNIVAYKNNDITLPEFAADAVIKPTLGSANDLIGAGINAATPDMVKRGLASGAQTVANAIDQTSAGQSAGDMLMALRDKYNALNPRIKSQLENAGNIASFIPAMKAAEPLAREAQTVIQNIGTGANSFAEGYAKKYPVGTAPFDPLEIKTQPSMTPDALGAASSMRYQQMRDAGATLNKSGINKVTYSVGKELSESGLMNKRLHGDTLSVIEDLNNDAAKGSLDLEKLDQYRQLLSNVVTDNTTKLEGMNQDALKANVAINAIDNAVDSLGKEHLSSGTTEAVSALNQARDLYAAKSRLNTIQRIRDNAAMTDNPTTTIRRGMKNLAKQVNASPRGWTAEEIAAINKGAKLGVITGALKTMGSRIISGVAGATGGAVGGGVPGALIGAGVGEAVGYPLRIMADARQIGKAKTVENLVMARPEVAKAIPQSITEIMKLPPKQAKEALNALRSRQALRSAP